MTSGNDRATKLCGPGCDQVGLTPAMWRGPMKYSYCAAALLSFGLASMPAMAKVSPEEAQHLKSDLTPLGGEKAANADGSIPAWDGGLTKAPADYKGSGSRLVDPFPGDKPLF